MCKRCPRTGVNYVSGLYTRGRGRRGRPFFASLSLWERDRGWGRGTAVPGRTWAYLGAPAHSPQWNHALCYPPSGNIRVRRSPHRRDFGLAPSSCRLPLKGSGAGNPPGFGIPNAGFARSSPLLLEAPYVPKLMRREFAGAPFAAPPRLFRRDRGGCDRSRLLP